MSDSFLVNVSIMGGWTFLSSVLPLVVWQAAPAKLPGQQYLPMIHDKFQELSVSVLNTPPPRPAPKPYPTGPHQSGVSKVGTTPQGHNMIIC
jgi:hypothetical protein